MEGVELIFLPPYTPQLNPAEGQVAAFKRRRAGRYFASRDALKRAIAELAGSGEVGPVKLMDYMLPGGLGRNPPGWRFWAPDGLACLNRRIKKRLRNGASPMPAGLARAAIGRILSASLASCPLCINYVPTSCLEKLQFFAK